MVRNSARFKRFIGIGEGAGDISLSNASGLSNKKESDILVVDHNIAGSGMNNSISSASYTNSKYTGYNSNNHENSISS